jgi:hypothetical protein
MWTERQYLNVINGDIVRLYTRRFRGNCRRRSCILVPIKHDRNIDEISVVGYIESDARSCDSLDE